MADRFVIFKGQVGPDLREIVTLGGVPVVFTGGDSVKLQGYLSGQSPSPLKIDAAGDIEVPATGQVHYAWAAGDTDTAGSLILWWLITRGGETQSSPVFVVPVIDQRIDDPGTMGVYASVLDVKALGGFLSDAWTQSSPVSERDLETFLALASGDIDVALAVAGATLPLTDPLPIAALRSLAADGALVRALDATWPKSLPAGALEIRTNAIKRFEDALRALEDGSSSIIAIIEQSQGAISGVASSLWTSEPAYGLYGWVNGVWIGSTDPADWNPNLAPNVARADVL